MVRIEYILREGIFFLSLICCINCRTWYKASMYFKGNSSDDEEDGFVGYSGGYRSYYDPSQKPFYIPWNCRFGYSVNADAGRDPTETCSKERSRSEQDFLWRDYNRPCNGSVLIQRDNAQFSLSKYDHSNTVQHCRDFEVSIAVNGGER